MANKLNHDHTLSNLRTEANYARQEKRWSGTTSKSARAASRRYNKAARKASKLQLSRYHRPSDKAPELGAVEPPEWDPNSADILAEQVREEYWDDCYWADKRFNDYCEEYDEVMQSSY